MGTNPTVWIRECADTKLFMGMQSMKINVMYRVSPLVNHLSATHLFCPSRRVRNPNALLEEDSPSIHPSWA